MVRHVSFCRRTALTFFLPFVALAWCFIIPAAAQSEKGAPPKASAPTAEKAVKDAAEKPPIKAPSAKTTRDQGADAPRSPAGAPASKAVSTEEGKLKFHFENADWKTVITDFAQRWGFALTSTTLPTGKFTYSDPRPLDQKQQMDVINSKLLIEGFVLARREKALLLHNLRADGPVPDAWVPVVEPNELDSIGDFELRKMFFPVGDATFETAFKEVKNLVERSQGEAVTLPGRVTDLPASKQLFVTETGANLRQIERLMLAIRGDGGVKAHKVKHIALDEALAIIKPLLGIPQDLNETTDGSIRLQPFVPLSAILATAKPDVHRQIETTLKLIDVEPPKESSKGDAQKLDLRIYPVSGPDVETVHKVLQTLMAGQVGVRMATDPANPNIIVWAYPDQHNTIKTTIERMQGQSGPKFRLWQLSYGADPALVLSSILEMIGGQSSTSAPATSSDAKAKTTASSTTSRGGPKININTTTRTLLAFGTETQLNQIDELLKVLKWSEGAMPTGTRPDRANVRALPFHRDAVDFLKEHFPSIRRNPIEVVVPSELPRAKKAVPEGFDNPAKGKRSSLQSIPDRATPRRSSDKSGEEPSSSPRKQGDEAKAAPADRSAQRVSRVIRVGYQLKPAGARLVPSGQAVPSAAQLRSTRMEQPRRGAPTRYVALAVPEENNPTAATKAKLAPVSKGFTAQATEQIDPRGKQEGPNEKAVKSRSRPSGKDLPGSENEPVKITVTENGFIISSRDLDALDQVERLLSLLPTDPLASGGFKIFFLKHIPAVTAKQELDQILSGDTTSSGGTTATGNLVGDVARNMLGGLGGSLVEGMLGSGSSGSAGSLVSGSAVIVPDKRLNALFIQASPAEMQLIQQILVHIDAEGTPETAVARRPGMIPVFFTNAEEIATLLRETYKDRLIGGAGGGGGGGQPDPRAFIEALRGGGGGNQRRGAQRDPDEDKMTIGVDRRSNSLIVVAPTPLFDEVKELVAVLDEASEEPANEIRHVLYLKSVSPEALARALRAIGGEKVRTSTGGGTTTTPGGAPTTPAPFGGPQPGTTAPTGLPNVSPQERMQQFQMLQEAFRGGQGGRGGGPGGGGGGGGFRGFGGGGEGFGGGRKQ